MAKKGEKLSEETKKRISDGQRGKKRSEEFREMRRRMATGKKWTPEQRVKMINIITGRKLSEETKRKISEAHKGMKHSAETCQKMSEITKKRVGPLAGNWKGGIDTEYHKARTCIEARLWRESVFARDAWTCQHCGDSRGGNLNAHHIKPFKTFIELRTAIQNGITLCKSCHIKVHKKKI